MEDSLYEAGILLHHRSDVLGIGFLQRPYYKLEVYQDLEFSVFSDFRTSLNIANVCIVHDGPGHICTS